MSDVKWLVVAVIAAYLGARLVAHLRPETTLSRLMRRRAVLRTDAHAMSRRELLLSALSFVVFALVAWALYAGVLWGGSELGWRVFEARPVVVLGKASLFVGAMAAATGLFLLGAAAVRRG